MRLDLASDVVIASIRWRTESRCTDASATSTPIEPASSTWLNVAPVAIIALDGMQSHRLAAPPSTSRSITVTSAPSRAA